MSERSGRCEQGEQFRASERVSGVSERANGRASGLVLTFLFLFVPDHGATVLMVLMVGPGTTKMMMLLLLLLLLLMMMMVMMMLLLMMMMIVVTTTGQAGE